MQAPVHYVPRPAKLSEGWEIVARALATVPEFAGRGAELLPTLVEFDPVEVHQGLALAAMVVERGITHLHAHFASLSARTTQIAAALTGVTYSFTAHAKDIFHETVDNDRLRRVLADAQHVVTISEYNFRHLRAEFPAETAHLHLIHNGLELDRFPYRSPHAPGEVLRIAAVGRLVEKKGFDRLIDAAAALTARGARLEVRIAGGGDLAQALTDRIAAAGLDGVVTLLGPQTQQEVSDLLRCADVFVAPCVVGADGNVDGLPTVLLEAMAMGVPAIASDVTGIPEVVHPAGTGRPQTGILIRTGILSDLVGALDQVARPEFDRQAIAAAARTLIETNFDSRRQAGRLRALLPCPPVPAERGDVLEVVA